MSASDLPIIEGADPRALTDVVFATVGEPVRSASLFYALYYLLEVEGVTEAAFDFKQQRERQVRGFYWYGIVSVINELSHLHDRYFIDGAGGSVDKTGLEPLVVEHIHRDLFPEGRPATGSPLTMAEWTETAFSVIPRLWEIEDPDQFRGVLDEAQTALSVMSDPEAFLRNIKRLMEAAGPARTDDSAWVGPDIIRKERLTGWALGYDGQPWEGIVDHLLRRGDISDTAWLDQCWSIEHNNRRWIDKIGMMIDPDQNEAVVEMLGLERFDDPRAQSVNPPDVDKAVEDILDTARDGPTGRLFDWAEYFNSDVDVNLRRWRRALNIR